MNKLGTKIQPGNELRGFMIRLYPTKDQIEKLHFLEGDCRTVWNWLVKQTEDALDANKAYAVRRGLVEPAPIKPDYNGLDPEQSKAAKKEFAAKLKEWGGKAYEATKKLPECSFRNLTGKTGSGSWVETFGLEHDYQLLNKVLDWKDERIAEETGKEVARISRPISHTLQSLVKNHRQRQKGARRKTFRKSFKPMPLQARSKMCFELGNFGSRGGTHKRPDGYEETCYYNCQIKFNGLKIRGRLPGKLPEGRVLEGVSIVEKADGWWAWIKQEVPILLAPEPDKDTVVGIDVGLDNIAAISEVRIVSNLDAKTFQEQGEVLSGSQPSILPNIRDVKFSKRIAELQKEAQAFRTAKNYAAADKKRNQAARLHLSGARYIKHQIFNEILKPLKKVETIKIEKLSSKIGQMGSTKVSVMRLIASMLNERYGEKRIEETDELLQESRVREVAAPYTSQECSQCGKRDKDAWSYEGGRIGKCLGCGYETDRDLNAARNVAAKSPLSLELAEAA